MEKKIQDYLHLYLGCKVEYEGRIGIIHQYYLPSGKYMEGKVWVCSLEEDGNHEMSCAAHADKVIPLLRPLSSMTWEEMKECGNMDYDFSNEPTLSNWTWEDFECLLTANQFHYLLSRGFDLFDLIPSGLALDKTQQ